MRRNATISLLVAALLLLVISPAADAQKQKPRAHSQSFADLCNEILGGLQAFYPVTATEMGIHTYDHRLTDYSPKSVKDMVNRLKGYETKLARFRNYSFEIADYTNYRLIKSNIDVALLNLDKIAWHRKSPQLYVDEAINGLYFVLLSNHDTPAGKLPAILGRMSQVPGLFATAKTQITRPPRVYVQSAKASLETGLLFYRDAAQDLMKQFPSRADSILNVSTAAREAMSDFLEYLNTVEVGDDRSFAIGATNFNYLLQNEHFLAFTADSLQRLGEALLAQADKAYVEYEAEVERNHQPGQDSVFVPASFSRKDILDYYQWEVDQLKTFVRANHIITIPEDVAPIKVVETPAMLRSMISSIAYQPAGPFDQNQVGYFYVRPLPDSMDKSQLDARYRYVHRRGFRGSAVHEAYPGHHLQMQIAGRNPNPVRKWQRNSMMIEGWALYSEELMYRAGLYGLENPPQWLATLGAIRFRAARIVADVKLHTGQWTYDECVDWMIRTLNATTEAEEEFIRQEVLRYTYTPTVQMSYLTGKLEIERLRNAAQAREGANFTEQGFYDRLLAQGAIPPSLIWELLQLGPSTRQTSQR